MNESKKIQSALISVYYKDGLDTLIRYLHEMGVTLYSTGRTQAFIEGLGIPCIKVEDLTQFPEMLGGRVKTLHPMVFGGILARRDDEAHMATIEEHGIPEIDLVIVNLYPFVETVAGPGTKDEIIEKIDIGGPSMIRAAAKNFNDVVVLSAPSQYEELLTILKLQNGETTLADREKFSHEAFENTARYDTAIAEWGARIPLRYGENPHQGNAYFIPEYDHPLAIQNFTQRGGTAPSLINFTDISAALSVLNLAALTLKQNDVWQENTHIAVVVKHGTPCGFGFADTKEQALKNMVAGDPQAAFGGAVVTNFAIDEVDALLLKTHSLPEGQKRIYDLIAVPSITEEAITLLARKDDKCRIYTNSALANIQLIARPSVRVERQVLGGKVVCDAPAVIFDINSSLVTVAENNAAQTDSSEYAAAMLADICIAHAICAVSKSNTITIVDAGMLLANASGQQSRVQCAKLAAAKLKEFHPGVKEFTVISDSFFPATDGVQVLVDAGMATLFTTSGSKADEAVFSLLKRCHIRVISTEDTDGRLFAGHC